MKVLNDLTKAVKDLEKLLKPDDRSRERARADRESKKVGSVYQG